MSDFRQSKSSVAILGAGMLGLTLAYRLARAGRAVILIDGAPELGGLTTHHSHADITWDRYYHVFDARDDSILGLLDVLGLGGDVRWARTRTLLSDREGFHPLNNALDYLRLPALPMLTKLRVGLNIVRASMLSDRTQLENLSAEQWLSRWSGQHGYSGLWAPLLRSKLGENAGRASAGYIWSVIRRFYGARQGAQRHEQFGYLPGGYARIINTMASELERLGVEIRTNAKVQSIRSTVGDALEIDHCNGRILTGKAILTYPAPTVVQTVPQLEARERATHEVVTYQGVVCVSLLTTRPFGNAYMTYMLNPDIPFTTIIEMSSLTGTDSLGGHHLVYLPAYVPADSPLFAVDDDTVFERFVSGLQRMYPGLQDSDIVARRIARARHVMALPETGKDGQIPPVRTSVEGLYVVNSSQILDAALSVNEAVAHADHFLDEHMRGEI